MKQEYILTPRFSQCALFKVHVPHTRCNGLCSEPDPDTIPIGDKNAMAGTHTDVAYASFQPGGREGSMGVGANNNGGKPLRHYRISSSGRIGAEREGSA